MASQHLCSRKCASQRILIPSYATDRHILYIYDFHATIYWGSFLAILSHSIYAGSIVLRRSSKPNMVVATCHKESKNSGKSPSLGFSGPFFMHHDVMHIMLWQKLSFGQLVNVTGASCVLQEGRLAHYAPIVLFQSFYQLPSHEAWW